MRRVADTAHTKYNRIFVVTDEDLGDHSAGRRQLLFAQRPLQAVANPCRLPPGCFCMMAQAAGLLPMMVNRAGTTSSAALILLALAGGQEHQLDEYLSKLLHGFLYGCYMDLSLLIDGFLLVATSNMLKVVTWNFQNCLMDLSKLLHGFVTWM